ncbi:hypothetical protein VTK56DRAFT_5065 [Thermocarpiscus australiensis]
MIVRRPGGSGRLLDGKWSPSCGEANQHAACRTPALSALRSRLVAQWTRPVGACPARQLSPIERPTKSLRPRPNRLCTIQLPGPGISHLYPQESPVSCYLAFFGDTMHGYQGTYQVPFSVLGSQRGAVPPGPALWKEISVSATRHRLAGCSAS